MRAVTTQRAGLTSIVRDLETLQLDAVDPLDHVLPRARALLDVEAIAVYSVRNHDSTCQFDRWSLHELPSAQIKAGMTKLFERREGPVVFYDLMRPVAAERNRLIEATSMIDAKIPGGWRATAMYADLLAPLGLGEHRQHRMLLCERRSLLAWFGVFHKGGLSEPQQRLLRTIAVPLRRRLWTERLLDGAPRRHALLAAALDHIGSAAFVLSATGAIVATNAAARRILATADRDVRAALQDTLAGRCSALAFSLTEIRDRGVPTHWLAVAQLTRDARLAARVEAAARRWGLTPRQREILALIVRGLSNVSIGAELGISLRATEMHVTALLSRAGVDNRAALVAAVLL